MRRPLPAWSFHFRVGHRARCLYLGILFLGKVKGLVMGILYSRLMPLLLMSALGYRPSLPLAHCLELIRLLHLPSFNLALPKLLISPDEVIPFIFIYQCLIFDFLRLDCYYFYYFTLSLN